MSRFLKGFLFLLLAGLMTGVATLPLSAQVTIPEGSTITSATFSIYADSVWCGWRFILQRITHGWGESSVTWNNFHVPGHFDDSVTWGSFQAEVVPGANTVSGWYDVDITALVQHWVNRTFENYGFVIRHIETFRWNYFLSSEASDISKRPKLVISYSHPTMGSGTVTIQRPADAQGGVADASIYEIYPDSNYNTPILTVARTSSGYEKYSLVRFNFDIKPPSAGPGTGTPGYWMNHPKAWPVDVITIGGRTYTKSQAIALMKTPTRGDMTYVMFMALVAAKLNVLVENDDSCIEFEITEADKWMEMYPVGSGVPGSSAAWKIGEPLYVMLDKYNNGLLCAPSRDSFEY